jgi:hypothetical protein
MVSNQFQQTKNLKVDGNEKQWGPGRRQMLGYDAVPQIIDPVFAKTSQNARFLLSENERFGLVFVKTGSINSGTGPWRSRFIFNLNMQFLINVLFPSPLITAT